MDEQISQFISITGASSDRARFFVEAANGDVEQAVSSFYENDGNDAPTSDAAGATSSSAPAPADYTGPRTLSGAPAELPSDWGSGAPATGSSAQRPGAGFSAGGGRGGIATLGDLRGPEPASGARSGGSGPRIGRLNHDDDDDEEEEEGRGPANLFAGGGRSALNVQNPDRGGGDRPDIVREILRQAAEAGAGAGPEGALPVGSGRAAPSSSAFSGRGRTIGDEGDSAATPEPAASSSSRLPGGFGGAGGAFGAGQDEEEDEDDEEPAIRHLTFWQDGFSVEDGPLMRYDDPAHEATLALIRQGRAPLSLLNVRFGQPVELRVADRKSEKYVPPPKAPMKPFEGAGNRLGSPSPAMGGAGASTSTTASTAAAAAVPGAATASSSSTSAGGMQFQVDASQPTTQIQIRLGDGSRLVGKFNLSHTVADVRRYIDAAHPSGGRSYTLHTSFPPKPLSDDSATIEAAGLKGAVVIQKWD